MASPTLRPLSVGEILDAGVKVVTRNWKPLLGSLLLVSTPVWILFILLVASADSSAFEFVPDQEAFSSSEDVSVSTAVGLLISVVALMLAFLVSFVAVFKGVCDAWLGARPSISRSLKFGLKRSGWVFLLAIIWSPAVTVFTAFCIAPGLWLGTVWCLSIPVLLFERVGPIKALGRSYGLIRGRFWESLLVVLVVVGVYYVVSNIISLGLMGIVAVASGDNGIANAIAQGVGSIISTAIAVPYISALLTILYFDQRVRKEGLDIQLLADGLGLERDPNAPIPLPLQAPAGYAVPPQPPPGWQSPTGWVGPQAGPPLRWGPNAEPPPSGWQTPAPGWSPQPWTPQPGPPSGAAPRDDSPWMTPDAPRTDAPPTQRPADGAPPLWRAADPPAPDAPPAWRPADAAPADSSPAADSPPAWRPADAASADSSPAADSPPASRPAESPPADAPAADAPPADAPPAPGESPWMSPPAEESPGWKPQTWKPTPWQPPRKDDGEDEGQT